MTNKPLYAEVAPAIPLPVTSAETYTYIVPQPITDQVQPYMPVTIPFGRRTVLGVIMRLHQQSVPYRTKPLQLAAPIALTAQQVEFGQWLSQTMQGGLGYTLRLFFPPILKKGWESDTSAEVSPRADRQVPTHAIIEPDFKRRVLLVEKQLAALPDEQMALVIVPETWMLDRWQSALSKKLTANSAVITVTADAKPQALREIWQQTKAGRYRLIIGTQKALFLPFQNLELVIIDEEYLPTHKLWDQYPRLDNRLGTAVLSHLHRALHISAGSIMSLNQAYQLQQKQLEILQNHSVKLQATVVSSTFEDRAQKRLLPDALIAQLKQWLNKKQRILILHNARGGWQTLYCKKCQAPVRCPECEVALTLHIEGRQERLECHHCGYTTTKVPTVCPTCGKTKLMVFGAGVEKVADILSQVLPKKASILNFDATSDQTKLELSLAKKATPQGQVVIATSAVFSRLPEVQFDQAMYLWPERGLLYPDFRSEERTMYLLLRLQALLPAKRKVVLVTKQPRLVQQSLLVPYDAWQIRQLKERQRLLYPPVADLIRLTIQDKDADKARVKAVIIRQQLEERQKQAGSTATIRGPFASFVKRRRGFAEVHLLLTGSLNDLIKLYSGLAVDVVDVYPERIL